MSLIRGAAAIAQGARSSAHPNIPAQQFQRGIQISRLQSFTHFQAPTLARPPGCSHRRKFHPGRPGRSHRVEPGWSPALGSGIATCPNRAIGMVGLSPTGIQPCRLLPHPLDDKRNFKETSYFLLSQSTSSAWSNQKALSADISVPPRRINEIVHGKRGITADTALRLARYFGTSERF